MREDHMDQMDRMFPRGYALAYVRPDGTVNYHLELKSELLATECADILNRFIGESESGEEWKRKKTEGK